MMGIRIVTFAMLLSCAYGALAGGITPTMVTPEFLGAPAQCPSDGSQSSSVGPTPPVPNSYRANPINMMSGNKFHEEPIIVGTGEFPLEYKLFYNSGYNNGTETRGRWSTSYSRVIGYKSSDFDNGVITTLSLFRDNGQVITLKASKASLASAVKPPNPYVGAGKLTYDTANKIFTYYTPDGFTEKYTARYSDRASLQSVTSPEGFTHTVGGTWRCLGSQGLLGCSLSETMYDREISDDFGKKITFSIKHSDEWPGSPCQGCVSSVKYVGSSFNGTTDAIASREYKFSFGSVIRSITWPDNSIRNFLYEMTNCPAAWNCTTALTGITDEEGKRAATWQYKIPGGAATWPVAYFSSHGSGFEEEDKNTIEFPDTHFRTVTHQGRTQKLSYSKLTINGGAEYPILTGASGVGGTNCANSSISYSYSTNNSIEQIVMGGGAKTLNYTYYPDGRVNTITNNKNTNNHQKIEYIWHPVHTTRLQKELYYSGKLVAGVIQETLYKTIERDYYPNGRIKFTKAIDNVQQSTLSPSPYYYGQKAERTINYVYEYHDADKPESERKLVKKVTIDGPRPDSDAIDKTVAEFDNKGRMTALKNAAGHQFTFSEFNLNGQPQKVVDPNSITSKLNYNFKGQLLSAQVNNSLNTIDYYKNGLLKFIKDANNEGVELFYTSAGKLQSLTDSSNSKLEQRRLTPSDTSLMQVDTWIYPNKNTTSGGTDFGGTAKFDALKRIYNVATYRTRGGDVYSGPDSTRVFNYDQLDNLTGVFDQYYEVNDPDVLKTAFSDDPKAGIAKLTKPDNSVFTTNYDAEGRVKSVVDPRGLTSSYIRNGFGEVLVKVDSDGEQTHFLYDEAGNITKRMVTGANSYALFEMEFKYDALNRPTKITPINFGLGDPGIFTYNYDLTDDSSGIGRLGSVVRSRLNTSTQRLKYDAQGRIKSKTLTAVDSTNATFVNGYQLGFGYNQADQLTSLTYPSKRIVTYTRGTMGRVTNITTTYAGTTQTVAKDFQYKAFSTLAGFTFGNGLIFSVNYNPSGEESTFKHGNTVNLNYQYKKTGQLGTLTDNRDSGNTRTYMYDKAGRLLSEGNSFRFFEFNYDSSDNRILKKKTVNTPSSVQKTDYVIDTSKNRISSVTGAEATTVSYELKGEIFNVFGKDRVFNNLSELSYMDYQRSPLKRAYFEYDGFGVRYAKRANDVGILTPYTIYIYDTANKLMAEMDTNGKPIREYIYLGDMLIAVNSFVDSDNDGMDDDWEMATFGDLTHSDSTDTDNDRVSDAKEYAKNLNPKTTADTDGDGLGDDWESYYFGNLSRDGTGDFDRDGFSDLVEYTNNYDPNKDQMFWLIPVLSTLLN